MIITVLLIALLAAPFAHAETLHPEKAYRDAWCSKEKGETEHLVTGGSRVDCLTATHAVEIEFARKWQEAIGQALYYARKTGKEPGIVLVMESPDDQRFLGRLMFTIKERHEFVRVWTMRPEDLPPAASMGGPGPTVKP